MKLSFMIIKFVFQKCVKINEKILLNSREPNMDEKLKNIIWLSISAMVMFTGYFTMAGTSETIIRAYNERTGDNVSSFLSFGILSVANAIGCFFVSPVVGTRILK